ncbi:hypothetical protein AXG89_28965 (plasmid) [Burkholderia sp. PAMC 26561]|nr:hypothetical protein [Burkholderia sp. PAMC 26561]AME26976.1 hypothetical protein AXG89_23725 [Burkholderia sp. PAMC 26561]AME27879.1 hypothetical protein AXG89_28965 [Burkholderia sp. PAMC 26561]
MENTFGDPARRRTPDIIVQPNPGVIYTSSKTKDEEHGGNAPDDGHLGLVVSYAGLRRAGTVASPVTTTRVAPTILQSLGLDPDQDFLLAEVDRILIYANEVSQPGN